MAIILGIDPGSHITGFGILRVTRDRVEHISHGVILLPKDRALPERLRVLSEGMSQILAKYAPTDVAIEKIFLGKSADSAFKLGHARGVVMGLSASAGANVHEYATRSVKKGVAGKGSADKFQVREMLKKYLRLEEIERLDASDALALAFYHSQVAGALRVMKRLEGVSL